VRFERAADFCELEVSARAARGPEANFDCAVAGHDEDDALREHRRAPNRGLMEVRGKSSAEAAGSASSERLDTRLVMAQKNLTWRRSAMRKGSVRVMATISARVSSRPAVAGFEVAGRGTVRVLLEAIDRIAEPLAREAMLRGR